MPSLEEKKEYPIYQEVFTPKELEKLPLTFNYLQKGDKANPYQTRRLGKSNFHQESEYVLHAYHKPVSKIVVNKNNNEGTEPNV